MIISFAKTHKMPLSVQSHVGETPHPTPNLDVQQYRSVTISTLLLR